MPDLLNEKKHFLSGWPMLIAWAAMFIFAIHSATHMVGAGDTWVAMACGRHFINHGVDTNEPFSANSHRQGPTVEEVKTWPEWAQWLTDKVGLDTVKFWHPTGWVNQNWLTHVIFSWLAYDSPIADGQDWTFNALVYWKFSIYILTVICVYYTGRVLGAAPALAATFACAAMFISRSFLDIRPAGYSNLLVAAFILIVALSTYRNHLYIWLILPLVIFWANVHGGYIYVFIALTPLIMLRLFVMLPKPATVSIYSILTWLALYAVMYKETAHDPFTAVALSEDALLKFIIILVIISIVLLIMRSQTPAPIFYAYHILATIVVFFTLMIRLFPELPTLPDQMLEYVAQAQKSYIVAGFAAFGMGIIVTLFKDRLLATTPVALFHTTAAAITAFIAAILFNPFHLTNLTHTLEISISPHAEGWRNVHEWWAAFRWENPVGTAFPYLVMLVVGGGVLGLYLVSRLLAPKVIKGQKAEQGRFEVLYKILGFVTAVFVFYTLMLAFFLTDVSPASILLCGLFAGILWVSVFINIHFIYLILPLTLFGLFTSDEKLGYLGRYIYPFILLPCYVLFFAGASRLSQKPKYGMMNIVYVLAAAAGTIIVMTLAVNPFKIKPIWDWEQFWNIKRLWSAVYEANLEVAGVYVYLFPALYIISLLCVVIWLNVPFLKEIFKQRETNEAREEGGGQFQLPKIDLALITIAAMTAYMAFRSRRFITIAAYVDCPVIAMMIQQALMTAGASWNFYKRGQLSIPSVPRWLQRWFVATAVVVILGLGSFWGWKFYMVYLSPWPTEEKLNSMFIRMTASHAKPFYACEFIKQNKIRGNMFNYWTEGGFIAWGQDPDPNGKTPLQLFMDGRAQAAYNFDAYQNWSEIMFGGEAVQKIRMRRREFTADDYAQIGAWINSALKECNVWVVLMPSNQFDTPFVRGLEYSQDWRLVFYDDKQKLYVDISTPRGKEIYEGLEDGRTIYPKECYREIMIAHNALVFGSKPEQFVKGLESAIKAYDEEPSRITVQMMQILYERYPQLRPRIDAFWKKTADDFIENKEKYLSQGGYHHRIVAFLVAVNYLQPGLIKENKTEVVEQYQKESKGLDEIISSLPEKTW